MLTFYPEYRCVSLCNGIYIYFFFRVFFFQFDGMDLRMGEGGKGKGVEEGWLVLRRNKRILRGDRELAGREV